MLKTLGTLAILVFVLVPAAVLVVGQLGFLGGKRPDDLGAMNGMFKPPVKEAWNVVSSQAALHPHTDYHVIAPLKFSGDGNTAFARLTSIVRNMYGHTIN